MTSRTPRAAAAVLLCVLAVSACSTTSTSAGNSNPNTANTASAAAAGGGSHFVWVGFEDGDSLNKPITCGATAAAAKAGDTFEMKTIGNGFTAALQIPVLQAAAATKPAGIIITPVDRKALQAPIDAVVAGGIKVITADQQIDDPSKLAGQVTLDNRKAGVLAADYLAQKADGKTVQVAIETFTAGASTAADGEWHGFVDELAKYPNVQNVATQFGDINTSTYISITSNILAKYPNLFGVFTTFAQPADAALASIASHHAKTIVVAGYGSQDAKILAGVKAGTVGAIVDFNWYDLGYKTTEQMIAATSTGKTQTAVTLPAAITTSATLDQLNKQTPSC